MVDPNTPIFIRRNQILDLLASGRLVLSHDTYSAADMIAAKGQPATVAPQTTPRWKAPHFVWAVQQELADKVCGSDVPTCDTLAAGGLTITTTLDTKVQAIAEKWVKASALVPKAEDPDAAAKALAA